MTASHRPCTLPQRASSPNRGALYNINIGPLLRGAVRISTFHTGRQEQGLGRDRQARAHPFFRTPRRSRSGRSSRATAAQVQAGHRPHRRPACRGLYPLAQGATAVGTGLNSPEGFAESFAAHVAAAGRTGPSPQPPTSSRPSPPTTPWWNCSGALNTLAVGLFKIAQDIMVSEAPVPDPDWAN